MKTLLIAWLPLVLLGLSACSKPAGQEAAQTKASEVEKAARQTLDKANAVQGQLSDAEARRRESEEKAE